MAEKKDILKSIIEIKIESISEFLKSPSEKTVKKIFKDLEDAYKLKEYGVFDKMVKKLLLKIRPIIKELVKLEDVESISELVALEEFEGMRYGEWWLKTMKEKEFEYKQKLIQDDSYSKFSPAYMETIGSFYIETIIALDAKLDKQQAPDDCLYYMSERTKGHIIKACVGYYGGYRSYIYAGEKFEQEDDLRREFDALHKYKYELLTQKQTGEIIRL